MHLDILALINLFIVGLLVASRELFFLVLGLVLEEGVLDNDFNLVARLN